MTIGTTMPLTTCETNEECDGELLSGLKCALPRGHAGVHYDRFGLRDPQSNESRESN